MAQQLNKNIKVRFYLVDERLEKPHKVKTRHFIHPERSYGLWAYRRDMTLQERLQHNVVSRSVAVQFIVGWNERILDNWERLIALDEKGNTYRLIEKPDEYDYTKCDLKLLAVLFQDKNSYTEDIYE